jgi:xylan 1,4-beta-xylosidase
VKVNLDCEGLANSLSYWIFTDVIEEGGAGDSIFHGGFGLINFQGIVKPAFHAYRMLHQLGDEALKKEEGMVVTRDSNTGKISALLYHYPAEVIAAVPLSKGSRDIAEKTLATGSPQKYALEISDLKPNTKFEIEILDQEHAFALRDWQKMGSPEPPTREQTQLLKNRSLQTKMEQIQSDSDGTLHWEVMLSPWAVVLLKEL